MERNRNLVVVLDGTSNQFGKYNSNCVEFYSHLEKSAAQLTYYNSGIGTYIDPNAYLGPTVIWQKICNAVDMGIAYRLRSYILGAYRWLSDHYRSGDHIFLYGFSRGAYEVRALAAMIHKVGLIHTGNEEQIPFAFDLYADRTSDNLAAVFKQCFSRDIAKVHFLGVWDTVCSVGLFRSLVLPGVQESSHIVTIRHAVSLDERRVKFQPQLYFADGQVGAVVHPDLNEVWFAGTHSDVGGGNRQNLELKLGDVPLLWMEWESLKAGVHLNVEAPKIWNLKDLPSQRPIPSLRGLYWIMELLHHGRGRKIPSNYKVHSSILFKLSEPPEPLWKGTFEATHPSDRKEAHRFLPYTPAAIRPIPQNWESLRSSIWPDHLAFFAMNVDLDASVEADLFDVSPSELDYLVTQTVNAHCHPSLRRTAPVRLIYVAMLSEAARDRFDESLIGATFDLLEQQDARLDRTPLHALWYLTGNSVARQHLLSDHYLARASGWINNDAFEITWAGLSLVRELLQGQWSYTWGKSQRFESISLPQHVIMGILRRWSNPNLSLDVEMIQICSQHVILMLWDQNTERDKLLEAGLIEKGFEVACQWTIAQATALNMLCSFMQDGNARKRVTPGHYQQIVQLLRTGPPKPDEPWSGIAQGRARKLIRYLDQYGLRLQQPNVQILSEDC